MRRYGERKTEVVAFGCTSRGRLTELVCEKLLYRQNGVGCNYIYCRLRRLISMPGETVLIQNKYRAGKRNSGRIVEFTKQHHSPMRLCR